MTPDMKIQETLAALSPADKLYCLVAAVIKENPKPDRAAAVLIGIAAELSNLMTTEQRAVTVGTLLDLAHELSAPIH